MTEMIRDLARQNEALRERVTALERQSGVGGEDPPFEAPHDVGELPRADGG